MNLSNSSYEAIITLLSKLDKDIARKESSGQTSLMNINARNPKQCISKTNLINLF